MTAIGPNTAGGFPAVLVGDGWWWAGFGCVVSPDPGVWADVEEDCSIVVFVLDWYGAFCVWEKLYTGALYPRISGFFFVLGLVQVWMLICFVFRIRLCVGYYNSLRTRLHYSIMITIFQHLFYLRKVS